MSRHWCKFQKGMDWRSLEGNERALVVAIVKNIMPPMAVPLTEDELMDSVYELINLGLVDLYVRHRKGRLETKVEFPRPKAEMIAFAEPFGGWMQ